MAHRTIRRALANALEDLTKQDFAKFCYMLLDRREEPRIRRNRVEGKNYLDVVDVMVSTFNEEGALKVCKQILSEIHCNETARMLEEETSALSSKPGSSDTARSSAEASAVNAEGDDEHFVDKYRVELIQRLSQVPPVLDHLLFKKIISSEIYDTIMAMPTSQDKMRELYRTSMRGGTVCKDIFYKYLEENHSYLIEDLQKRK